MASQSGVESLGIRKSLAKEGQIRRRVCILHRDKSMMKPCLLGEVGFVV